MSKKILIIEDDAFLGDVLAQKCKGAGYDAEVVTDGLIGLNRIKEWRPDLILLDILLPSMNGFDILREKKKDSDIAAIPVIVVTNSGDQTESDILKEFNVREFLVKAQFDPGEILVHVNRILIPAESTQAGTTQSGTPGVTNPSQPANPDNEFLKQKKIMWVEDDKFLSDLISRKLYLLGCNVVYAETGEIALTMIEKEKPDIVLLDILLPGITGIEVLEKVKSNALTKEVPIIMLSNYSQENDIKHCFSLGAEKYLVKATVTLDEIVDQIKEVLKKHIK